MRRPQQILFLAFFLGVICSVLQVQTAVEAARGRRPWPNVLLESPTKTALRRHEMGDASTVYAGNAGEKVPAAQDGLV